MCSSLSLVDSSLKKHPNFSHKVYLGSTLMKNTVEVFRECVNLCVVLRLLYDVLFITSDSVNFVSEILVH